MGGGGRTEGRRRGRSWKEDNFPRELCVGALSHVLCACAPVRVCVCVEVQEVCRRHVCVCRARVCVACVCLCLCVSRVINTAVGAVTRAEKIRKFPQAERGPGEGDTLG